MVNLMKKRKYLVFLVLIMLCYSLFPSGTRAQSSSQISISSQGSINYAPTPTASPTPSPSPTPTPTASPTPTPTPSNLTPFPTGWETPSIGGTSSAWSVGLSGVTNVVLDNSVLYNGQPTIRIDPTGSSTDPDRENDGPWITVHPGDHLVFSGWVKTQASTIGDTYMYHGICLGVDFYGANGRICGVSSPTGQPWTPSGGYPSDNGAEFVSWGHTSWVQIKIDFTVASQYPADTFGSGFGTNFAYSVGQMVAPVALIPYFWCMNSSGDTASAWFAGAVLYINP